MTESRHVRVVLLVYACLELVYQAANAKATGQLLRRSRGQLCKGRVFAVNMTVVTASQPVFSQTQVRKWICMYLCDMK